MAEPPTGVDSGSSNCNASNASTATMSPANAALKAFRGEVEPPVHYKHGGVYTDSDSDNGSRGAYHAGISSSASAESLVRTDRGVYSSSSEISSGVRK